MDPETAKGWLEIFRDLGAGAMAVMALVGWGLYKGKLRWEREALKCERETAEWQARVDTGTALLDKSTKAIELNSAALERLIARVERIEQGPR